MFVTLKENNYLCNKNIRMRKSIHTSVSDVSSAKKDKHPFISGFSKIIDWNNSYNKMLGDLQRTPTQAMHCYWQNVGIYTWDAITNDYE